MREVQPPAQSAREVEAIEHIHPERSMPSAQEDDPYLRRPMVANNLALTRSKEIMRQVLFQLVAEFKQSNNRLVIYAKSSLKGLIKDHAARGGIEK